MPLLQYPKSPIIGNIVFSGHYILHSESYFIKTRRMLFDGPMTLEFAISFLKVLNIDFPLILISLNVVERSLLL